MEQLYREVKASERLPENYNNNCSKLVNCVSKDGRPISCYYNYHLKVWKTHDLITIDFIESWLEPIEPTKSAEEFLNDKLGTKDYTHSPLSIYRKELAEWLNEYDQSQLPSEEEILNILTIYERLNSREVGEAIDPSLPGNQAVLSMKAKAIVKRFKD